MVLAFAESIEQQYLNLGQDPEFLGGLALLRKQLKEHVTSTSLLHKPQPTALSRDVEAPDCGIDMEFDLDRLDGAWPSLWADGLNGFCVYDSDQDVLNSFLLGLSRQDFTQPLK